MAKRLRGIKGTEAIKAFVAGRWNKKKRQTKELKIGLLKASYKES
jgi:hypothetical protein